MNSQDAILRLGQDNETQLFHELKRSEIRER